MVRNALDFFHVVQLLHTYALREGCRQYSTDVHYLEQLLLNVSLATRRPIVF